MYIFDCSNLSAPTEILFLSSSLLLIVIHKLLSILGEEVICSVEGSPKVKQQELWCHFPCQVFHWNHRGPSISADIVLWPHLEGDYCVPCCHIDGWPHELQSPALGNENDKLGTDISLLSSLAIASTRLGFLSCELTMTNACATWCTWCYTPANFDMLSWYWPQCDFAGPLCWYTWRHNTIIYIEYNCPMKNLLQIHNCNL